MGYISKGISLSGKEQLKAMEAFDLAFVFSDREPITIDLLLLIKVLLTLFSVRCTKTLMLFISQAIVLFNASHHDEAMRRVQDLATACQHSDPLPCSVVNVRFMSDPSTFPILKSLASHIYVCSMQSLLSRMGGTTKRLIGLLLLLSLRQACYHAQCFVNLD